MLIGGGVTPEFDLGLDDHFVIFLACEALPGCKTGGCPSAICIPEGSNEERAITRRAAVSCRRPVLLLFVVGIDSRNLIVPETCVDFTSCCSEEAAAPDELVIFHCKRSHIVAYLGGLGSRRIWNGLMYCAFERKNGWEFPTTLYFSHCPYIDALISL